GRVSNPTWKGIKSKVNPNLYTIGIEHEGKAHTLWSDAMYQASANLIKEICQRWKIPIDRAHVVGHREIYSGKTCPGSEVSFEKLIQLAQK
ncbi:MAG TPA: peptidoglycan recognition family protein, partial [Acidobacteriota bacterium]|nr:peptidoglycan recognition family protein [Acidobacteriota bacterium]